MALNAAAAFDAYTACRGTGGFIIVDRISNATAAAGMVIDAVADASQHSDADELAGCLRAFEVELNALVLLWVERYPSRIGKRRILSAVGLENALKRLSVYAPPDSGAMGYYWSCCKMW